MLKKYVNQDFWLDFILNFSYYLYRQSFYYHIIILSMTKALSSVIKRYQALSSVIKRYQALSSVIKRYQALSSVIKRYQALSSVIKRYQNNIYLLLK